jgi:DNA-binding NtrC family response regulator
MDRQRGSALVVDNDRILVDTLSRVLRTGGYAVHGATSGEEALALLAGTEVDVVLLDVAMPGIDGLEVLARVKERWPDVEVVMVSGHQDLHLAVEAVRLGALDYLAKDALTPTALLPRVQVAIDHRRRHRELLRLREEAGASAPPAMVFGGSPAMQAVEARVQEWAALDSPVLVHGEPGTGKEMLARRVHLFSGRAGRGFVNCRLGTIPADRLEEHLFGREGEGAGSVPSRFELASGGTLFLDEVTLLPPTIQDRLLEALESGRIRRVGGRRAIAVDVRLIAASRHGPEELAGLLRGDLVARLGALPLRIPPLRERIDDLPALFAHFLRLHAERNGCATPRVEAECLPLLAAYGWPANVRELELIAAWLVATCRAGVIRPGDVPFEMAVPAAAASGLPDGVAALDETVSRLEKHVLLRALERAGWNRKQAAQRLGLAYSTMKKKIRLHGLAPEEEGE